MFLPSMRQGCRPVWQGRWSGASTPHDGNPHSRRNRSPDGQASRRLAVRGVRPRMRAGPGVSGSLGAPFRESASGDSVVLEKRGLSVRSMPPAAHGPPGRALGVCREVDRCRGTGRPTSGSAADRALAGLRLAGNSARSTGRRTVLAPAHGVVHDSCIRPRRPTRMDDYEEKLI